MAHLSEDDLVLHYYGEADFAPHLDECAECREQYRTLQSSLNMVNSYEAPPAPLQLEAKVWNHIAAAERIPAKRRWSWRWILLPTLSAACLAIAFFAGRFSKEPEGVVAIAYLPQQEILRAQTADHFQRSKLVLLETVHTDGSAPREARLPRERAEELLSANRLLRRSAQASGNTRLAEMLDELERILVEIANSPENPDAVQTDSLRARIRDQGVLFRLAVTEKQIETKNETEVSEE
jgi:hypothetical protein